MGELGRGRPQFEVCAAPGTDAVARLLPGLGVSARGTYDRKGYTSHSSFGAKSARAKSLQWPSKRVEALGEPWHCWTPPGQSRYCPGHSGTVGNYAVGHTAAWYTLAQLVVACVRLLEHV